MLLHLLEVLSSMARLPRTPASVLAKALVSSGFSVLHSLFLALDANLAHAAAQREICCVRELPCRVRLLTEQQTNTFHVT